MQRRLLLSINKIISQTPRNLSSFWSSEAVFSLSKRNPLPQFFPNHPLPYSFAHYNAACSNSWRSPLLPNAAALLKGQSKGFVNHHRSYHSAACGNRWWANYQKCRSWSWRNLTMGRMLWGLFISNVAVCTVSLENFGNLCLHTMITSGFNLADTGKPVLYMIGLYVFGSNIGRTFGGEFLLSLYLAGTFVGSALFLVGQKNVEKSAKGRDRGKNWATSV